LIIKDLHILILIGIIIVVAGGAVWGTIKFAIPNLKEGLGKINKRLIGMEHKMNKVVTNPAFEKEINRLDEQLTTHQGSCQVMLVGRIDEVRTDLKGMDRLRERARLETVSRGDFEEYKEAIKADINILAKKMDAGQELLTRLDERVLMLLKANGVNAAAG
jgi:hypothetical protein